MARGGPASSGPWSRLSREPWDDREPIRAEIFNDEALERHAVTLADSQVVVRNATPVVSLLERMEQDDRALVRCYEAMLGEVDSDHAVTPAAEWLVDNFHAVEEHLRQVRRDLPPGYFRQLPKLGPGFLEGHPRIFGVMWAYVAHTDSTIDPDQLGRFIRAHETRKAFTLGELWAAPITLRIILIENVRRVSEQIVEAAAQRTAADRAADLLLGVDGSAPQSLAQVLPDRATFHPGRAFAVHLLRRLAEQPAEEALAWLRGELLARHLDPEDAIQEEHQAQAGASLTMRNIFRSLRALADVNWEDWLESVSLIEAELRTNPGYGALDFTTRNLYRSAIERLARGSGQVEIDVTRAALTLARTAPDDLGQDVGFWLVDDGLKRFEPALGYRSPLRERYTRGIRRAGLPGYFGVLTLVTGVLLALSLWLVVGLSGGLPVGWVILLGLLAAIPASDYALGLVNYRATRILHASVLPALALREGVPEDLRTLVVVPTMLTSRSGIEDLVAGLEVHHLANDAGEVYVAAVTDWADSATEHRDDDEDLLDAARSGIRDLNARYGDRFFLFHRTRRYNAAEGVWMGWERKRGKLEELNDLLRGAKDTSFATVEGRLRGAFRYVITLDSDTVLPRGAAKKLVAKLAHPLNRARFDPRTGRLTRGYSILQPRVTPSLPAEEDTSFFQAVYSTQQGLDPYAFAISDVYQDLFREGSFAGKGIYDVDALTRAIAGRIPENSVLSHDLLEGNYARAALVTDVEVVEEHPTSYEVAASRTHRWTRGDWQLLPWILHRREGLSALGLWKMLDNLRRSLSPVALVVGLLVAVAVLPAVGALAWFLLVVAAFFLPSLQMLGPAVLLRRDGVTKRSQARALADDGARSLTLGSLDLVFLGHQAALMVDAIARTLWRMVVSHRHLLEWTTAAAAQKQAKGTPRRFVRLMAMGFVAPIALLVVAATRGPAHLAVAVVPAALWFAAPFVAERVSRRSEPADVAATPEDLEYLRVIARRTWAFFTAFVTAEENHLPPDNVQEDPEPVVAHRTSPTNIGLYLLTTVSARDFRWIGLADAVDRLEATMRTLSRLGRHRGHLFNWYDTRTLAPLPPRYVSTVDSGNLAGHLLVLAATCREWAEHPSVGDGRHGVAAGVADGVALVRQALADLGPEAFAGDQRLVIEARLAVVDQAVAGLAPGEDPGLGLAAVTAALAGLAEVVPLFGEAHTWIDATRRTVDSLRRDTTTTPAESRAIRDRLAWVAEQARREFDAMDFSFLIDRRRELFSVGYRVDVGALDEGCYDLLASECRLTSYLAIAKGDVRTRHWFRLGRSVTAAGGGAALLSWSGSMFEYLMPPLVMHAPVSSLLSSTSRRIVREQIEYGTHLGVPWGISESGFNARDLDLNYQYSPFGVPGLGIVRGLADNVVIAPYATGLAAMLRPAAAAENYRRLAALGARGSYGYYEAVDYTRSRLRGDQQFAIVRSFMAHHQGMTIVALDNLLHDGVMRERFHAEPIVRATELLLQERAPRDVPVSHARTEERRPSPSVRAVVPPAERTLTGAAATAPGLHLMSNGRLSLRLTPTGGGQLTWKGIAVTRWHPDLTTGDTGDYIYLREDRTGHVWSATAEPVRETPDSYEVRFAEDRARYSRTDGSLRTVVEHHLSPESDAVVRSVSVRNDSRGHRRITVTSYAELVLAAARDDDAHPAFSKLFVHTEYLPGSAAIVATRRRRSSEEGEVWAAHFVVAGAEGGLVGGPAPETDRLAFLGRNRTTRSPRRLDAGAHEPGTTGYVLDPIFSLSQDIDVPPEGEVTLHYWTVVAATREEVLRLVAAHRAAGAHDRVTTLGWTQSQVQLRHLGISPDEAGHFQVLAGHVIFPHRSMRAPERVLRDAGPQSALWSLGISGDPPIVVVRIDDVADLLLVRQVVKAFTFWRLKRFAVDLVLLNERATSYVQDLQQALTTLAGSVGAVPGTDAGAEAPDAHGRIVVVRRDQADSRAIDTLLAAAAVVLVARRGDLTKQLARPAPVCLPPTVEHLARAGWDTHAPEATGPLLLFNGFGGFSLDGREYVTVLDGDRSTPGPWMNVVANGQFGFHATAEGAGYTWWLNSRDNQITPWRNDPVSTPVSEAIYVRDEATGRIASPTSSPVPRGRHVARHGFGYTRFTHEADGVELDETVFVAPEDPVKIALLTLTNTTGRRRSLTVTAYAELVLGTDRTRTSRHLLTDVDGQTRAFLVRNPWSTQFPDQVVFLDLAGRQESWTGDRREFLGLHGTAELPLAVFDGRPLSGAVGPGLDPCAALQQRVDLDPGGHADVLVVMGAGHGVAEVRDLVARYRATDPREVLDGVRRLWARRLAVVQVKTPSETFDVMMNGWLLYQTLACRMLARSGYYQASGAYGFRDQLQDSMTVALVEPALARSHILRAAGRQFLEGDVQHWWLPTTGEGVRTRISDDVVWLAHAVCRYIEVTGDAAVLDEQVPFIEGDVLGEDQPERYFLPSVSDRSASLYEHCVLAVQHAFPRGSHGLPLMGTGDWNDGMNRVGAGGEGESVWLGWFLHTTLTEFGALARTRGDVVFAERCRQEQESLVAALEEHGWDGAWYRRGYFDDGTPLGSASRTECRIDGIAQSWAVLSGAADPARAEQAMEQLEKQLFMEDEGIVRLFTPPFDVSEPDPGYIRAYPPGVRENGGQYTHGALWSVFAWAALGREDRAGAVFERINPVTHALTPEAAETYRVEPYVVAADVFAEEPHVGRGGWTWYTGSAGWMYRAGLEAILGMKRHGDVLEIAPCLPPEWREVGVTYRFGEAVYEIAVDADCDTPRRVARVVLDGAEVAGDRLPLVDDGATHPVRVEMETRRSREA